MNLNTRLDELNIALNENFFYNIQKYKEHLLEWNKTHNLTGAKDEATIDEFIVDALYPLTFLPKVKNILDIGTGAGFPGLILAMALRDTQVTLAEPLKKRASFLQFIKATLGLTNVTVISKRVENIPSQTFELVTSRAVMDTKLLLELSKNHRDKNSLLLFYKGERVYEEVDEHIPHQIIKTQNRHYLLLGK